LYFLRTTNIIVTHNALRITETVLKEYKFTQASLKMSNGIITLKTPVDIAATEAEQQAAIAEENKKQADRAKNNAERQKKHRQTMKEAGFEKHYVDAATLKLSQDLGGIELIPEQYDAWMRRALEAERKLADLQEQVIAMQTPRHRSWWKFW
jgi:hypothetical protein